MNFGSTIEEQYVKISAINKLISKFSKVFSIVLLVADLGLILVLFGINNGKNSSFMLLIYGAFLGAFGFFVGKFVLGKIYGWAWVLFCDKYNPKGLAKYVSNAAHNTAIEGYIWGGSSGAQSTSIGFLIGIILFINFYIWKGTFYMIKYRNLPQKEIELKKQLDIKYGKIS